MLFSRGWLERFVQEIESELCLEIESQKDRFSSYENFLKRFRKSAELFGKRIELYESTEKDSWESWQLEKELWKSWMKLVEDHNEICVAYEILKHPCIKLEYEPKIDHTEKRIDFYAIFSSQKSKWIEVKTIHPNNVMARIQIRKQTETNEELNKAKIKETSKIEQKDWDQYQASQQYFPQRTELTIFREGAGAEIWHDKFAARSQILKYTLEFEKRIGESSIGANEVCILALAGNGYDWHLDELEDFATFYHTGKHLAGDIFSKMEHHSIKEKDISLSKRINHFAYFKRRERSIKPNLINWNVKPPKWPLVEE